MNDTPLEEEEGREEADGSADAGSGETGQGGREGRAGSGGPPGFRRFVRNIVIVLAAFAVGYLIQFREARSARVHAEELSAELEQTELDLEIEVLGHTLAGAALYAVHGDYRLAREEAINFFDGLPYLRMRMPPEKAEALAALAERRDDITGLLGTEESFGIYQLADVFAVFNRVVWDREYQFTVPAGIPR